MVRGVILISTIRRVWQAYALAGPGMLRGGSDPFSKEAIRSLLTEVENSRTETMVVLAGYKDKMAMLMRADPGLDRRFPLRINLPDYTPEDLGQICRSFAANKFGKQFEPGLARPAQTKQNITRLGLCGAHS